MGSTTNVVTLDPQVIAKIKRGKELIAECIHRLFNTAPGERVRNVTFGTQFKRMIFEQNDFVLQRAGSYLLREAIARELPMVDISGVNVYTDPEDPHRAVIYTTFRLKSDYEEEIRMSTTVTVK